MFVFTAAGVIGWISDSYCSIKPLCSGMGEVVPARTSPTLLPHPLALCCHYPVSKCPSASIVVTSTSNRKKCFIYINITIVQNVGMYKNTDLQHGSSFQCERTKILRTA